MAYRCKGADNEDLTPALRRALGQDFETRLQTETVTVRCSLGHANAFGEPIGTIDLVESQNDN
jgi:hypothetical protein